MVSEGVKICCIGDPHYKPSNRLETTQLFSETEKLIERETPDIVVVLGDILDKFDTAEVGCYREAVSFLKMIKKKAFLILLIGNHDRKHNQVFCTDEHFFVSFEHSSHMKIVWKPEKIKFEKNGKIIRILALPYIPTGRMEEAFTVFKIDPKKYDIVFAHQEFQGAKMGCMISENGDIWKEEYPFCVSGHIHQYDKLQSNLLYPGTPFQHGFSDTTDKCVIMLNVLENKVEFEKHCLNIWNKVNITLSVNDLLAFRPEKNTIYNINCIGNPKTIKKTLQNDNIKKLLESNQIHIRIKSTQNLENDKLPEDISQKDGILSFYEYLNDLVKSEPKIVQHLYSQLISK